MIFSLNENPALRAKALNWPDVRLVLALLAASVLLTWLFHGLQLGWMGEDRLERSVHLAGFVTALAGWPVAFLHVFLPYRRHVIRPGLMKPVRWERALLIMAFAILLVPALPLIWLSGDTEAGRFPTVAPGSAHMAAVLTGFGAGWFSAAAVILVLKYRARLWIL